MYKVDVDFGKGSGLHIGVEGPHAAVGTILDLLVNPAHNPESITITQVDEF